MTNLGKQLAEELRYKLYDHPNAWNEDGMTAKEIQMTFEDFCELVSYYGVTHAMNWATPAWEGIPVTFLRNQETS